MGSLKRTASRQRSTLEERHNGTFSKLTAALIHPHPLWQRYALYALSNTTWSEFDAVLSGAIENDAFEPAVQGFASAMLADLRSSSWNHAFYTE